MILLLIFLIIGLLLCVYRPAVMAVMLFVVPIVLIIAGIGVSLYFQPNPTIEVGKDTFQSIGHVADIASQAIKLPVCALLATLAIVAILIRWRLPDDNMKTAPFVVASMVAVLVVITAIARLTSVPIEGTPSEVALLSIITLFTEIAALQIFLITREGILSCYKWAQSNHVSHPPVKMR